MAWKKSVRSARDGIRSWVTVRGSTESGPGLYFTVGPVYSIFDDTGTGDTYTFYRGTAADREPGSLGRYVPLGDLSSLDFGSSAISTMLSRYVIERERGDFSLYVGDELRGDVPRLT